MVCDLPRTQVFDYDEAGEGEQMEFRLVYDGPLHAEGRSGGRADEKQELRKHFHKQLRELWKQHVDLRRQATTGYFKQHGSVHTAGPISDPPAAPDIKSWIDHLADDHARVGYRFVPLINKENGFTCSLDILFLRRDDPGNIFGRNGGDIDNRLKTLFDGLKMPETGSDLGRYKIPDQDENPFFCLLEDDGLITKITVNTDRLLITPDTGERETNVYLVIHVTITNPSAVFAGGRLA